MTKSERVELWVKYAENDLSVAGHLFETHNPLPTNIICYHCQQAAEKALKSILIQNDVTVPKTHDIDELLQRVQTHEPSITLNDGIAEKLTTFAVESRYPDNVIDFTKEDTELGLKYAREILDKVKTVLNMTRERTTENKEQKNRLDDEIEGDFLLPDENGNISVSVK